MTGSAGKTCLNSHLYLSRRLRAGAVGDFWDARYGSWRWSSFKTESVSM